MRHLVAGCPNIALRIVSLLTCGALSFGCGGSKSSTAEEPPVEEGVVTISSGQQPTSNAGVRTNAGVQNNPVPVSVGSAASQPSHPSPTPPAPSPQPAPPDVTPPVISATPNHLVNAPILLTVTADEPVSWEWQIASGPSGASLSAPSDAASVFSAALDGVYEISVSARDAAGNASEMVFMITWDTTPPAIDAGSDVHTNVTFTPAATASDYTELIWTQVTGPDQVTFSDAAIILPQISAPTDGSYTLRLTVTDAAGNSASDEFILRWDTSAPVISDFPLTGAAADGFLNGAEHATPQTVSSGVAADESITSRYAVIAGSAACDATAPFQTTLPLSDDVAFSPDDVYRLCAEVTDALGYLAYALSDPITVDTAAPTASAAGLPAPLSRDQMLSVSVSGPEVSHYRYKIGTATTITCAEAEGYSALIPVNILIAESLQPWPNDDLKLCVTGADIAGNEQPTASASEFNWTIDRVPPAPPTSLETASLGNGSRYQWQSGSPDSISYVVVRRAGTGVNFQPLAGEIYTTGDTPDAEHLITYSGTDLRQIDSDLTSGTTYFYAVHAVDAAGNISAPATGSVIANEVVAFNVASGFNNIVRVIFRSSTGHIYLGGDFTTYINYPSNRLIRLNSDYSIDTTFSIGSGFNGSVYALAEDVDGNIVAAGSFTTYKGVSANRIIKIDTEGYTVPDFNIGTGLNNTVYALAVDKAAGTVYAGGAFTTYKGAAFNRIIKLLADGSVDSGFVIGAGFNNNVFALDWDPDNSLLYVGGQFTSYQGTTRNRILRLTSTGAVDASFAVGTAANNIVYAIVRDAVAGKIYAGGNFSSFAGVSVSRIIKLNASGSRDAGFTIGTGFSGAVRTLALTSDGSAVYAGGDFTTYAGATVNRLARIFSSGVRDIAFINGSGAEASVFAVSPASETEVLWGGQFTTFNGSARNRVMLTDNQGTPNDELVPFGAGLNSSSYDAVGVGDGMYTIVGAFTSYNARTASRIIRIGADNQADTSFVTGAGLNNTAYTVTADAVSAKVYVGGIFTSYAGSTANRIVAINNNGTRDTTFVTGTGFNSDVQCVRYDPVSKKIYVSGKFTTYNGNAVGRIVRLNLNGSLDSSFSVGTGFNSDVNVMHINADGTLYAGGAFTTYNGTTVNRIVKLMPDGTIDPAFVQGSGFNTGNVFAITAFENGIYVGGSFSSYQGVSASRIVAIDISGARYGQFAVGSGFNNTVYTIAVDPFNGDLVVGGNFTQHNGVAAINRIARLRKTGVRDASLIAGVGANGEIRRISVTDQSIYAAGLFSTYNGVISGSFMRLQHYGRMD